MGWRIGVDIGGTFTDVVLVDEQTGHIGIAKVSTTPGDVTQGVIDGLREGLAQHRVEPTEVTLLAHATTIVTNALLEKKGAKAGFVATRGFRDVLELRRSSRPDLYDLFQDAPAVLVPRRWRFEVTERIDAQGQVVTPLDEDEIDRWSVRSMMPGSKRWRCRCCSRFLTTRMSGGSASVCAARCPGSGSTCRRRSCPRSASSSAPARQRCAPMSGPC
jgi:Hydantoinase/oxoprolinase N-terminal region